MRLPSFLFLAGFLPTIAMAQPAAQDGADQPDPSRILPPLPLSSSQVQQPYAVLRPSPVREEPPAAILAAVDDLRAACGNWHRSFLPGLNNPSMALPVDPPERILCDSAADPQGERESVAWFGVACGTALTIAVLLSAGLLRMILLWMWLWRPRPRTQAMFNQ